MSNFATMNPANLWPQGQVSGFSFYMRLQYSSDTFSGSSEIFMSEFLFIFLILHDNMELFTLPHILAKSIPTSAQRYNFSTTPQNDNGRFYEFLYLANWLTTMKKININSALTGRLPIQTGLLPYIVVPSAANIRTIPETCKSFWDFFRSWPENYWWRGSVHT